jgi:hypothetical protein
MKTKVEIVEAPQVQSYTLQTPLNEFKFATMFGDQSNFLANMQQAKYVNVDVHPHTKTSVYIAIHLGNDRYGLNSEAAEGLKYLEKNEINMMAGYSYTAHYLKAKTLADVQQHIEHSLQHFFPSLELDGFTLKFYNTERVQELERWKYPPYKDVKHVAK